MEKRTFNLKNRLSRGCHKAYSDVLNSSTIDFEPVVMSNCDGEKTIIWWNEEFTVPTIYKLIQSIEVVRQSEYKELKIYFSSIGGDMVALRTIVDYLNELKNIKITIFVNGIVASAGFYILLMIDNRNINIQFDKYQSSGLIHLADSTQSGRGVLSNDSGRYNLDKFYQKHLEELNNNLTRDYLDKLDLTDEDRDKLQQGYDVILNYNELSRIVIKFREDRYRESEECEEEVIDLIQVCQQAKERFKYLKGKSMEEYLEEIYSEEGYSYGIGEV